MTLSDLRDALGRAAGPDRELDAAIMAALFDAKREKNYWAWQARRPKGTPERPVSEYWRQKAPPLTGSIDAAVMLVPEGWGKVLRDVPGFMSMAHISPHAMESGFRSSGRSLPIALCLARVKHELSKAEGQQK